MIASAPARAPRRSPLPSRRARSARGPQGSAGQAKPKRWRRRRRDGARRALREVTSASWAGSPGLPRRGERAGAACRPALCRTASVAAPSKASGGLGAHSCVGLQGIGAAGLVRGGQTPGAAEANVGCRLVACQRRRKRGFPGSCWVLEPAGGGLFAGGRGRRSAWWGGGRRERSARTLCWCGVTAREKRVISVLVKVAGEAAAGTGCAGYTAATAAQVLPRVALESWKMRGTPLVSHDWAARSVYRLAELA